MDGKCVTRKIISDPIHGQISLHPLCIDIMDTPQFQRLRRIKQLGFAYTVYPSAVHDRFSHSLGVSHLARKFLCELLSNSRDVMIDGKQMESVVGESEVLCLEIAGLCHDLGHGPFSHSWEVFMMEEDMYRKKTSEWKHEDVSLNMLDYLIRKNELQEKFKKYNVNVEHVKKLINGDHIEGKPKFLSQIVNNEDSGLDVDKWDYYLRDCYHLGMHCSFEYERLIRFARVMKVDNEYQICFRDKVQPMVYNMFRTRSELHHLAYQHRVVKVIEKMVCDALVKLDLTESNGIGDVMAELCKKEQRRETLNNKKNLWELTRATVQWKTEEERDRALECFCDMTDDFIYRILKVYSETEIIDCLERRSKNKKFYKFICQWSLNETEKIYDTKTGNGPKFDIKKIQETIRSSIDREISRGKTENCQYLPSIQDLIVQVIPIHWGKKNENPVKRVYFYSKDSEIIQNDHSEGSVKWMQPTLFQDVQVRILCRNTNRDVCKLLKECCENYRKNVEDRLN